MRTLIGSAAVVVASATVFSMVSVGAADAFTKRELKICWANTSGNPGLDLEPIADGPSFRSASLDAGECVAWDVRPGRYDITVDDASEFRDAVLAACPGPGSPALSIRVKRQNHAYQAYTLGALLNGNITTTVRNNRATTVSLHLRCT